MKQATPLGIAAIGFASPQDCALNQSPFCHTQTFLGALLVAGHCIQDYENSTKWQQFLMVRLKTVAFRSCFGLKQVMKAVHMGFADGRKCIGDLAIVPTSVAATQFKTERLGLLGYPMRLL